jgi:hydroxylamine dehydrogenase
MSFRSVFIAVVLGTAFAKQLPAANCRSCHEPVYQQFLRSRYAGPSWAAVYGKEAFTAEQIQFSE